MADLLLSLAKIPLYDDYLDDALIDGNPVLDHDGILMRGIMKAKIKNGDSCITCNSRQKSRNC